MILVLLIYIIGVLIHRFGFGLNNRTESNKILDYPEIKEYDSLFEIFSLIWPLFWLVFLYIFLKEVLINLIKKIQK
jgi:hypothetical protein